MKNSFERSRFKTICLLVALAGLLCFYIVTWCLYGEFTAKNGIQLACFAGVLMILYICLFSYFSRILSEVEKVSQTMEDVIDKNVQLVSEEYREGSVGMLYTRLCQMVGVLQESRNRELNEKIFLRDIISDISHQLKTPLASLNVFVDLLMDDRVTEPEKQKQILNEASNQLSRMEWMVLSMLKLARIEAGAIQFEKTKGDLLPILRQAGDSVRYLFEGRKQELFIDCDASVVLRCDGQWLTEALINLLKNASDYSEEGKRVWLTVEDTNAFCRIYVKDEGMGIEETELPNIFKRFYRVHQEVNPNSVGIGLSLSKSIVEGMGGSLKVRSELGKYTWFILTFVKW